MQVGDKLNQTLKDATLPQRAFLLAAVALARCGVIRNSGTTRMADEVLEVLRASRRKQMSRGASYIDYSVPAGKGQREARSPRVRGKCLIPVCDQPEMTRGLCTDCYRTYFKAVKAGLETWDDLMAKGLVLPCKYGGGAKR